MSYRIEKGESLASAFGRIAGEQLEMAENGLGQDPSGEAVHVTRKAIKRLRALLRSFRDATNRETFRAENKRLGAAGRKISSLRDVHVQLSALGRLHAANSHASRRFRQKLLRRETALCGELPARRQQFSQIVADSRQAISQWPTPKMTGKVLAAGLKQIYKEGRRTGKKAANKPSARKLHEWRKKVKSLSYGLKMMKDLLPRKERQRSRRCGKLEETLGIDHDFFMVSKGLRQSNASPPDEIRHLEDRIAEERLHLQKKAFKLRGKIFGDKPRAFEERLERALVNEGL